MADIFISHSEKDRDVARQLATFLEGQGRTVWWDAHSVQDAERGEVSMAELDYARAVIVIWSRSSLGSPFVLQQAITAREARKLVQVTYGIRQEQSPLRQASPMLDSADLLQIALAVLPHCDAAQR
jgi:TIR domain